MHILEVVRTESYLHKHEVVLCYIMKLHPCRFMQPSGRVEGNTPFNSVNICTILSARSCQTYAIIQGRKRGREACAFSVHAVKLHLPRSIAPLQIFFFPLWNFAARRGCIVCAFSISISVLKNGNAKWKAVYIKLLGYVVAFTS